MKKKSLLVVLLLAIVAPWTIQAQSRDMWDLVTSFSCSTGRQHGIVYDGQNIYTSAWGKSSNVLSMFYKYDLSGNLIEEFDIEGFPDSDSYLRDMTFDGQYFYGCDAHSGTIWCVDFYNKTLVGQINTSLNELGHCTYDPVHDAFWVGERATGSSPSLKLNLKLVNREGTVISSASQLNLGGHTVHGTGYFTDENGDGHIYLFAVEGYSAHVFDYDINADTMTSDYIFDFSITPGWGIGCSAGGAYIGNLDGTACFFGDVDKSPNLIGVYSLGEYIHVDPVVPDSDIFFDFNNCSYMQWTTIDGDGDGLTWELRQNWNNTDNTCSFTSASYDGLTETALFPENYLVSPYKLDCEEITFIANVQDASMPDEHIGVAVSTTGNADASDFVIVWETDMSAKTVGFWHYFDVDLRAFQGQDIYVAIVHFNCTNQFMVNVDDITLHRVFDHVAENNVFLNVYPNPATDCVTISSESTFDGYEVYNMLGALVRSSNASGNNFVIDVRDLPVGTYLIRPRTTEAVRPVCFVKK